MPAKRTLQDLYIDRCMTTAEGKLTPHFWQPMPMQGKPFCLFADESKQFTDEAEQAAVLKSMRRLITLGLELELDVGKFVLEQTRGEYPDAPYVKELLKSAVADEARHDLGFQYAAKAYGAAPEADIAEARQLRARWSELADKYQPLSVAAAMEQEVFLVTLGVMRICGGSELNDLAMQIAKDESRHVATNRAVAKWLGVDLGKDVTQLVDDTLEWSLGGMSLQATPTVKVDMDFCRAQSRELRNTGKARRLDAITRIARHVMSFEVDNKRLYSSRVTEEGQAVY